MRTGSTCRRAGTRALLAVLAVASLIGSTPAAGSASASTSAARDPARRLLVLSLPTLSWFDLHRGNTPNLDRLLDRSAVADLSLRSVVRHTRAEDAYATVGAGTPARGVSTSGFGFGPDESVNGDPAPAIYRRITGERQGGAVVSLAVAAMKSRNAHLKYDARIGALGDALSDAGIGRAVIGNADERSDTGDRVYGRHAVTGLMDSDGKVPEGEVGSRLVRHDPEAPFGWRYDQQAVAAEFRRVWSGHKVVLVEGSDLARQDHYRSQVDPQQRPTLRQRAVANTDRLVGMLLASVDLSRDAVMVVGTFHTTLRVELTVVGVHAPGVRPGLLRSGTTRRNGFVTLSDVAPTILELMGVRRPSSMTGRPFERASGGGSAIARRNWLLGADRDARFRDSMVSSVATVFVILNLVLWVAAAWAIRRRGRRSRAAVAIAALALLAFLPLTYLSGLLAFYRIGSNGYWLFLFGGSLVAALVAWLAGSRDRTDPLLLALAFVFGLLVADVVTGAHLQLNTVFGYAPTIGGRFAGFGNLAFGQLAAAAFLLCGLLVRRLGGGRRAIIIGLSVLGAALVLDGAPIWGSDVGGVLALVPAIGATATLLFGWRFRGRLVAAYGLATFAVIGVFAAFDLSRPPDRRTHLGRLVESVRTGGLHSFSTVVGRKLDSNLGVLTTSIWTVMVPIALGFVGYLVWRAPSRVAAVRSFMPAALVGLGVAAFLGFALNDSGIAVPGVMLGVANIALVYLVVRPPEPLAQETAAPGAIPEPAI